MKHRPAASQLGLRAGVMIMLAAIALTATSAVSQRRQQPSDEQQLRDAVRTLTIEAEAARAAGTFEHDQPNFAERADFTPAGEPLLRVIFARTHRDPFVDAYVRWQLLSFEPEWPAFTDAAFMRMLGQMPAFVENPKADQRAINMFEQAAAAGPLRERDRDRLQQLLDELDQQQTLAKAFNRPAEEFRDWVMRNVGEVGIEPRLLLLEQVSAHIMAGWPVGDAKGRVSRNFSASVDEEALTARHRAFLVQQAATLIGPGRNYINEITFLANGTVRSSIWSTYVSRQNVEAWEARLAGRFTGGDRDDRDDRDGPPQRRNE